MQVIHERRLIGTHVRAQRAFATLELPHLLVAVVSHLAFVLQQAAPCDLPKRGALGIVVQPIEDCVRRTAERAVGIAEPRFGFLVCSREVAVLALEDVVCRGGKLDVSLLDGGLVYLVLNDLPDAPHHVAGVAHDVAHLRLLLAGVRAHRRNLARHLDWHSSAIL